MTISRRTFLTGVAATLAVGAASRIPQKPRGFGPMSCIGWSNAVEEVPDAPPPNVQTSKQFTGFSMETGPLPELKFPPNMVELLADNVIKDIQAETAIKRRRCRYVVEFASLSDLDNTLSGQLSPDNPLKWVIAKALEDARGCPVRCLVDSKPHETLLDRISMTVTVVRDFDCRNCQIHLVV